MGEQENPTQSQCTFCGRTQDQVDVLVAGLDPVVTICDRCVAQVEELIAASPGHRAQLHVSATPRPPAERQGTGHRVWYIPDGYLPPTSAPGSLVSHESVCVLNTGSKDATVRLTLYFEDRAPMRNIVNIVRAERTLHIRMDKPEHTGEQKLPRGVPYAVRVESDEPIVVQHSRLDTTQPALALFTTLGFPDRTS